jgi:hypothetical protein
LETTPSSRVRKQLELDRPTGLLLHNDCTGADVAAHDQVPELDPDHVGAPQLAIDRQVEQRAVTQSTMLVKEEADGPNLLRL